MKEKFVKLIMVLLIFLGILFSIFNFFSKEATAFGTTKGAWEYFPGGRVCMGDGTDCTIGFIEPIN